MSQAKSVLIWLIVLIVSMSLGLLWDIGNLHEQLSQSILFQVRIPKVLEAALAGAGLTLAGLIFQTLLNNPLADSFTLGLASGATFGSGVAVALGLSFLLIPVSSILFSLITLALMLTQLHAKNSFHNLKGWQKVSKEDIIRKNPAIMVNTAGQSDKEYQQMVEKRGGMKQVKAVKDGKVKSVNGDQISRPGPRIDEGLKELRDALYE